MGDKFKELLEVFGAKSAPADSLGTYMMAIRELDKSQDELGSMGERGRADNPYFIELLSQYPGFADWEERLDYENLGWQKYQPTRFEGDIPRFEEAKKDTSYYKQSIMDSLIQAYGFDKLK